MKNLVYILFIFLFVTSCSTDSSEQNEIPGEITTKQQNFAQEIVDKTPAIKAVWKDDVHLEVTFESDYFGDFENDFTDLMVSKMTLEVLATKGFERTGKNICVHIYYDSNPKEIDRGCLKHE